MQERIRALVESGLGIAVLACPTSPTAATDYALQSQ